MNDPVMEKARRIIEAQLEAIGFDIDALSREMAIDLERQIELRERRRKLELLYRMHGGSPASYAPEREMAS